jgi:predicted Zn-dependent protease
LAWARNPAFLIVLGLAVVGLIGYGVHVWPERYLDQARARLLRRDYEAARTGLNRYLEARPDSAEAHLLLAQLDRRSNQYTDAARHLDACRRLGGPPEAIELERALAAVQSGVITPELDALCYKHLTRKDADEYLILEALSQGYVRTYRLTEALACLERMLAIDPDSGYALRRRAWIFAQSGQQDRAEADFRRAVEIDPEDRVARQGLAQILLGIRRNGKEAAEQYERLWQVQQDQTVLVGLARSWRLLNRHAEARQLLDGWLVNHPQDALILAERGQFALDDQAMDEAASFLRRAVALSPYLDEANHALYLCLERQGKKVEAEACQERIRRSKADRQELVRLTRQVQATPGDADLRCRVAELFLEFGEDDEGLRWLFVTLQARPDHRPSHRILADYYEKHGHPERAAEHRRLAGPDVKGTGNEEGKSKPRSSG